MVEKGFYKKNRQRIIQRKLRGVGYAVGGENEDDNEEIKEIIIYQSEIPFSCWFREQIAGAVASEIKRSLSRQKRIAPGRW